MLFVLPPSALKESVIEEIRSRLPSSEEGKHNANINTIQFDLRMAAPFHSTYHVNYGLIMRLCMRTAGSDIGNLS